MTDLVLTAANDLEIDNGQLVLINKLEVLTHQRIIFHLRSFTKTLFNDVSFGIDQDLLFAKNTTDLLDQNIKGIVSTTAGVVKLLEFTSKVESDRVYRCTFTYEIESGEIETISQLSFTALGIIRAKGVWVDGKWDYFAIWDNAEIWGN